MTNRTETKTETRCLPLRFRIRERKPADHNGSMVWSEMLGRWVRPAAK